MSTFALDKLLKLSRAEKLKVVEALWDSLAAEPDKLPTPASHKKELARRRRLYQSDPQGSTVAGSDAFHSVRKALGS